MVAPWRRESDCNYRVEQIGRRWTLSVSGLLEFQTHILFFIYRFEVAVVLRRKLVLTLDVRVGSLFVSLVYSNTGKDSRLLMAVNPEKKTKKKHFVKKKKRYCKRVKKSSYPELPASCAV